MGQGWGVPKFLTFQDRDILGKRSSTEKATEAGTH